MNNMRNETADRGKVKSFRNQVNEGFRSVYEFGMESIAQSHARLEEMRKQYDLEVGRLKEMKALLGDVRQLDLVFHNGNEVAA